MSTATEQAQALRPTQVRILRALAKGDALTKRKICAAVFNGGEKNLAPIIGSTDPARAAKEEFPSLQSLKFVTLKELRVDPDDKDSAKEVVTIITASGKKALEIAEEYAANRPARAARVPKGPKVNDPRLPKSRRITRTYRGKDHVVTISKEGFTHKNKTYNSLSAVAKAIIGKDTEINGYHFFGLLNGEPAAK